MGKISINLKEGTLEKEKNEGVVGIDLGTTNSLIAYIKDNTPALLGKETIVPSVVYFDEGKNLSLFKGEQVVLYKLVR